MGVNKKKIVHHSTFISSWNTKKRELKKYVLLVIWSDMKSLHFIAKDRKARNVQLTSAIIASEFRHFPLLSNLKVELALRAKLSYNILLALWQLMIGQAAFSSLFWVFQTAWKKILWKYAHSLLVWRWQVTSQVNVCVYTPSIQYMKRRDTRLECFLVLLYFSFSG